MRGTSKKRSVNVAGHATSLSLEEEFWRDLHEVAHRRGWSLSALIGSVDARRNGNLSSALRVFVLDCYRRGELGPAASVPHGGGSRAAAPDPVKDASPDF